MRIAFIVNNEKYHNGGANTDADNESGPEDPEMIVPSDATP